jgi:hypothetical protein
VKIEVSRKVFCSLKVNEADLLLSSIARLSLFEDACNYASEIAFRKGIHELKVLHDRIYWEFMDANRVNKLLVVPPDKNSY